jgi:hypothetical protein
MRFLAPIAIVTGGLLLALPALAQQPKPAAHYWMSIATDSMSMPGMEGAGADMGVLGAMGMGGMGGGPQRTLLLDLVGPETPPSPAAEHEIPPGLKMGRSLPLLTPPAPSRGEPGPGPETDKEREDWRFLLYWGCGETVRAGQPRVFDTAKLFSAEQSQVFSSRGGPAQYPPRPRKGWTYGEWPNRETRQRIPADGSLQGEHLVKGNYNPDIRFRLDQKRDFMEPVRFTRVEGGLADPIRVEWKSVPTAIGYFMTAMATNEKRREIIMWSSSELQDTGAGLMDYLPNATVNRFIKEKVVFGPDVTRCTVPKGIFKDTEGAFLRFIAYGEELNLAQPPKPADPKAVWNPIWTAKVRVKSVGMAMLGGEGGSTGQAPSRREAAPKSKEESSQAKPPEGADPLQDAVDSARKLKGLFGF